MISKNPAILLIYTGGTIGMVKEYGTEILKPFSFDNILKNIPELQQLTCSVASVSFDNPIDSSDVSIAHWIEIVTIIEHHYKNYSGFVILHGSDTMSYTASALSFLLKNLSKPVILTGSQLPIGHLRTDAKENLITAIQIAALEENGVAIVKEVGLYFEYKLYRGNRTTKISAAYFNAFHSFNYPELVQSGVELEILRGNLWKNEGNTAFFARKIMDNNVATLKLFPGMNLSVLDNLITITGLKVLILETYGSGNAPADTKFLKILDSARQKGILIINVTQCAGGSVKMGEYNSSSELKKLQVISGKDITIESALCKTMYLLGLNLSADAFRTQFETSICGEIS